MSKIINGINNSMMFLFFVIGIFGVLVISHETYHYFSIDGQAQGICFGHCNLWGYENLTNETWVVSAVHWELDTDQAQILDNNLPQEEKHAWIFSSAFTVFLMGVFFLTEKYRT
jgi:hypothetical protein